MKTIGIISLSNGLNTEDEQTINALTTKLKSLGIDVVKSKAIFKQNNLTLPPKIRAKELMKLYKNSNIDMIFDVSGGDAANSVLDYIDFDIIKENPKKFFGFSDLSVIMNSIYKKTNQICYWFQLKNIVYDKSNTSLKLIANYILNEDKSIFNFKYKFLQGNCIKGTVIGGNLRCTLKLAGTEYMPSFEDNILLIESLGGNIDKITTYLTQYKQMGAFKKVKGIILGTFTELESTLKEDEVNELILNIIDNKNIPIIKTYEIGHSSLSKSIAIGENFIS
ncbi:MAG: LD-carboxypeptidase [Clostridium sp.]|nr:LD-carboxypeptidase [Clostridium sp.]